MEIVRFSDRIVTMTSANIESIGNNVYGLMKNYGQ